MNLKRDLKPGSDQQNRAAALTLLQALKLSEGEVRKGNTIPQAEVFRRIEGIIEDAALAKRLSDI